MIKNEYIANSDVKLFSFLQQQGHGFTEIKIASRKGDIKVNSVCKKQNELIAKGSVVTIFTAPKSFIENVAYEDENILVVIKPKHMEVINETTECLLKKYLQKRRELYAVHRLDTNTTGLVIFAKNKDVEKQTLAAIKTRKIKKAYYAVVGGKPKQNATLTAFLTKDAEQSKVKISKDNGDCEIITLYSLIKPINTDLSLIEVKLETGKTHQIRAHLSYEGLPVLGDSKYGNRVLNKKYKQKTQCLVANKIVLGGYTNKLSYLNNKEISYNFEFNFTKEN